ncbi:MAG: aminoacyl-histidine dipeptidase, partial [Oscillospiraceae bacterium]
MSALNIEPKKVFDFFELIASVPHGSDNTAQITELCCKFARQRGLEYYCDKLGNVIIYKNASCGYETHETVILQGHLDMVAVKTADCTKDLEKDG